MWARAPRSCQPFMEDDPWRTGGPPIMHSPYPTGEDARPPQMLCVLSLTPPATLFNLTSLHTSNLCAVATSYAFTIRLENIHEL